MYPEQCGVISAPRAQRQDPRLHHCKEGVTEHVISHGHRLCTLASQNPHRTQPRARQHTQVSASGSPRSSTRVSPRCRPSARSSSSPPSALGASVRTHSGGAEHHHEAQDCSIASSPARTLLTSKAGTISRPSRSSYNVLDTTQTPQTEHGGCIGTIASAHQTRRCRGRGGDLRPDLIW